MIELRAAGAGLVIDAAVGAEARIMHWGRDLGPVDLEGLRLATGPAGRPSSFDEPVVLTLVPGEADGWLGRPGIAGHRDGRVLTPRFAVTAVTTNPDSATPSASIVAVAPEDGIELRSDHVLSASGVLEIRHTVTNTGADVLDLVALEVVVPLPSPAVEVLDLSGRWSGERVPQRTPLSLGTRLREVRRGRTGHDAPLLMVAGTPAFSFRRGEVWAVHVGWSGDQIYAAERLPEGAGHAAVVLRGGELLRPGEVRLAPGESYATPPVSWAWSDAGLDGLSARLHRTIRARPCHPRRPRPVVLNTWEAVYFDHSFERLAELARVAAGIGVERFVLDDGWFNGRRHDRAGLGDWHVDGAVWPRGLHPLRNLVAELGMEFGLWVEPEMVNADSDLARSNPEWVLGPVGRAPRQWRHQQVLDLTRRDVADHVFARLDALIGEYALAALKWDHNRDLSEAVSAASGQAAVHRQTEAVYALLDRLRTAHPELEIESCASGGGRVDLGILARTDRVWASDTADAVERQPIQRWTSLLLPPELIGSHVGPPVAHTTGRTVGLEFRCLTSLFAHAGIEWDLTAADAEELKFLASWIALYRQLRPLLHGGDVVRGDDDLGGALVHGVVAPDRSAALHAVVRLTSAAAAGFGGVRLPGLDPARRYRVRVRGDFLRPTRADAVPAWWAAASADGVELSGAVLTDVGLQLPVLDVAQGFLLHSTS